MNIRKNARLTPIGRERLVALVLSGQTPEAVARAAGVCLRTVCKWSARFKAEGTAGLSGPVPCAHVGCGGRRAWTV